MHIYRIYSFKTCRRCGPAVATAGEKDAPSGVTNTIPYRNGKHVSFALHGDESVTHKYIEPLNTHCQTLNCGLDNRLFLCNDPVQGKPESDTQKVTE